MDDEKRLDHVEGRLDAIELILAELLRRVAVDPGTVDIWYENAPHNESMHAAIGNSTALAQEIRNLKKP